MSPCVFLQFFLPFFRLDTLSNLTFALYLEPEDYAMAMEAVKSLTETLHIIFNEFMNKTKSVQKRSLLVSTFYIIKVQFFFGKLTNFMFRKLEVNFQN